jgi:hypothetical protein
MYVHLYAATSVKFLFWQIISPGSRGDRWMYTFTTNQLKQITFVSNTVLKLRGIFSFCFPWIILVYFNYTSVIIFFQPVGKNIKIVWIFHSPNVTGLVQTTGSFFALNKP